MTLKDEFLSGFRSLRGTSMKEKRESLFQLLNHTKQYEAEIDFYSIEPQTPLEEVFKVETLIFFKRGDDLLKVLSSENSILIHKVLKVSHWFINQAFAEISGEQLVTEIFPNISYNTKLKLLHKFSNFLANEQKGNEYFEAIRKRYGLFLASKMLPACSGDVILKCLDENKIEITAHQLLIIVKKYPKIIETIFVKLENQNYNVEIKTKYKNVFGYLARNNYALFLKLNEKHKSEITLGTRSSKKVFVPNRDSVIKRPNESQTLLKQNRIIGWLKEDRFEYFCNLLPKSLKQFQSRYSIYFDLFQIRSLAKTEQLDLLLRCFRKVYNSELWDYPILVIPELFYLMSPDERESWMSCHSKPKEMKDEVWISLMKSEKSVPLLKEKLDATTDWVYRKELITDLVKSCRVNDDVDSMFDIFQHIIKRYTNTKLRLHLMDQIADNFDLTKFTEKHWNFIAKIIPKYLNNYEEIWSVKNLLKGYGYYCFENNQSIPTYILSKWLKNSSSCDFLWWNNKPEYERKLILAIGELIPIVFTEESIIAENYTNYLFNVHSYNRQNINNKMSYFENLTAIKYCKLGLTAEPWNYIFELIMQNCLKLEFQKCLEEGLVETYFNKKPYTYAELQKNLILIMRTHPQTLANLDSSAMNNWYGMSYGLHYFKYVECFNPLPNYFEEYSNFAKFENDPEELNKSAINCLSNFLKPEVYFDLTALYYPKELTANCETESEKIIYKLQRVLIRCLRNVMSPEKALTSLMKFCQGDYLKMSHGTLYSITNNVNENKLTSFINLLNDRAVSVRKYSVYLAFRLLDKEAIYDFLTKLMKFEKNGSVRKYLLKGNLLYFLRNQEDRFYELLKENIQGIDSKDTEVYDLITNNIKKVSPKYFQDFFVFSWKVLENEEILEDIKIKGRTKLLSAITKKNIELLPQEFCSGLINKYLFKWKEYGGFETKMSEFASNFIIYYGSDDLEKRIRLVLVVLKPYVESTWYDIEGHLNGRKSVSKFVLEFCKDFLCKDCGDFNIINRLLAIWQQEFKPCEIYYEFLYFNFTAIYSKSASEKLSPSEIGESIGNFCNILDNIGYSNVIIIGEVFEIFKVNFVSIDSSEDENETGLLMAENILKLNVSSSGLLLSMILLLGLNSTLTLQLKEKYKTIFREIVSYRDVNVQIYLHQHILRSG